jgi:chromosomal replication initiation ATPase DnaA
MNCAVDSRDTIPMKSPRERHMEFVADISRQYKITTATLLGESRARHIVSARREVAEHLHDQGLSSVQIGRLLNRDHTSILHLLKTNNRKPQGAINDN